MTAPAKMPIRAAWHPRYALAAVIVFLIEVAIALWVRDSFIRPYLGDVLAVILVYLGLRAVSTIRVLPAALTALAVGVAVEITQAADLLGLLGLSDVPVARIVLGTSFSVGDLACYAAGAAIAVLVESRRQAETGAESLAFPREAP